LGNANNRGIFPCLCSASLLGSLTQRPGWDLHVEMLSPKKAAHRKQCSSSERPYFASSSLGWLIRGFTRTFLGKRKTNKKHNLKKKLVSLRSSLEKKIIIMGKKCGKNNRLGELSHRGVISVDFSKISDFLLTKLSEFAYLSDALYWHRIPDANSSGFPDGQKNTEPGRAGNTPAKTPRQLKKTRRYTCIPFYFVLFECAGIARDVPSSLPATTPEPGALRRGPSPSSRSAGLPPARHPPPAARAVPLPDGSCHCRERSLPAPPSARSDRDGDGGLAKETETLRIGRLKA